MTGQREAIFRHREEAAGLLAQALRSYRGKYPLVLAIPRGAVPMARIIADDPGGEADIVLMAKLHGPMQHELAIAPGASHSFEEPGALESAARLAGEWLSRHFIPGSSETQ